MDKHKYGGMYVPEVSRKQEKTDKTVSKPNSMDALREEIESIKDQLAKKNRDQLDAMYNLDMDNFSGSLKRLFSSFGNAMAEIKVLAEKDKAIIESIAKVEKDTITSISGIRQEVTDFESIIDIYTQYITSNSNAIASIKEQANANGASIESLTQYVTENVVSSSTIRQWVDDAAANITITAEKVTYEDGDVTKTLAQIAATATSDSATLEALVESVGQNGEVTAASIAAKIIEDESLIELIADKVTIEGTVTMQDVENKIKSTTISGNKVYLNLPYDEWMSEETDPESELSFTYDGTFWSERGYKNSIGRIYTKFTGSDSLDDAKFALVIESCSGLRQYVDDSTYAEYEAALKLVSARGMSLESEDGVYINGRNRDIQLDAPLGTRIRAYNTYDDIIGSSAASPYDYVFASDGIYYKGKCLVSTDDIIIS